MEIWRKKAISVTKYNPALRDDKGRYLNNEWTSYSDIGKEFNKKVFTEDEYLNTEKRYISFVKSISEKTKSETFMILKPEFYFTEKELKENGIDKSLLEFYTSLKNQNSFSISDIELAVKLVLREYVSFDIVIDFESQTIIRFGYDYYMYINSNLPENEIRKEVIENKLFS